MVLIMDTLRDVRLILKRGRGGKKYRKRETRQKFRRKEIKKAGNYEIWI
jgi:hypothetical protein